MKKYINMFLMFIKRKQSNSISMYKNIILFMIFFISIAYWYGIYLESTGMIDSFHSGEIVSPDSPMLCNIVACFFFTGAIWHTYIIVLLPFFIIYDIITRLKQRKIKDIFLIIIYYFIMFSMGRWWLILLHYLDWD